MIYNQLRYLSNSLYGHECGKQLMLKSARPALVLLQVFPGCNYIFQLSQVSLLLIFIVVDILADLGVAGYDKGGLVILATYVYSMWLMYFPSTARHL